MVSGASGGHVTTSHSTGAPSANLTNTSVSSFGSFLHVSGFAGTGYAPLIGTLSPFQQAVIGIIGYGGVGGLVTEALSSGFGLGRYIAVQPNATAVDAPLDDANAYAQLQEIVTEMGARPAGVEFAVDNETMKDAVRLLSLMSFYDVPPPKVFSPSPDAIAFTWRSPKVNRYATLTDGELYIVDVDRATHAQNGWEPFKTVGPSALNLVLALGGRIRSSSSAIAA